MLLFFLAHRLILGHKPSPFDLFFPSVFPRRYLSVLGERIQPPHHQLFFLSPSSALRKPKWSLLCSYWLTCVPWPEVVVSSQAAQVHTALHPVSLYFHIPLLPLASFLLLPVNCPLFLVPVSQCLTQEEKTVFWLDFDCDLSQVAPNGPIVITFFLWMVSGGHMLIGTTVSILIRYCGLAWLNRKCMAPFLATLERLPTGSKVNRLSQKCLFPKHHYASSSIFVQ